MTTAEGPPRHGGGLSHPFLRYRSDDRDAVRSWTDGDDAGAATILLLGPVVGAPDAALPSAGAPPPAVLTAVGEPERLARLLRTVELDHRPAIVALSRGTGALVADRLDQWGLQRDPLRGEWDRWGMVDEPGRPAVDGGSTGVLELDVVADGDEIQDLLAIANPTADERPGGPRADRSRWYGWRQPSVSGRGRGRLVAVGCATATRAGSALVQAVATHPDHRGRGLASAVTGRATADGLRQFGVVTVNVIADNHAARRVYARLGFDVWHRVESWTRRR